MKNQTTHRWPTVLLALLLALAALVPATAHANGPIVLDGQFGEWAGQPAISDPAGDCGQEGADIVSFAFGTNPDDSTAYFMATRAVGSNQPLGLRLLLDTNNNGNYSEPSDRIVEVRYQTQNTDSRVDVTLLDGTGAALATIANNANWGDSNASGGTRIEWGVSFAQLGILAGQAVRMTLHARQGNIAGTSTCDGTAEVQWSPADALGWGLLALALIGGAGWLAHQRRRLA